MNDPHSKRSLRAVLDPESLESRCLLTANPVLDMGGVTVDYDAYDPSNILVKYKDSGTSDAISVTQRLGGRLGERFKAVPGLHRVGLAAGQSVDEALTQYRNDPNVLYAEPDYLLTATAIPDDPRFDELWGLNNEGQTGGSIDADSDVAEGWDVITGGNLLVAVIDTGVNYNHEDLAANMWVNPGEIPGDGIDNDNNGYVDDIHGYDFTNNDGDPMDDHRHGTHVAGTIGAVGNNGIGIAGVNWDLEIMAIKFLDASGNGSTSDAIEAIGYAVDNGAAITNASWGANEPFSQALYDAIADARDANHLFVAGAGNGNAFGIGQDNDSNPFYPASFDLENIISVAATDHNDNRAGFSNYGTTSVDLAAPGVDILSTTLGNNYELLSGTSMASPHVAGVASLVWQHNPTWTYDQVRDQILNSVDAVPSMQGITTTGGRLNAATALGNPVPPPPPPPPVPIPFTEDFQDNIAEDFQVRSGTWSAGGGQYSVTPTVDDPAVAGVSTVRIETPLPSDFEVHATLNASPELGFFFNYLSNAYVVFDYQNDFDFKFAGVDVSGSQWVIGQRTGAGWSTASSLFDGSIAGSTDYGVRLVIENDSEVSLFANGVEILSHSFGGSVTDGELGLGVRNSVSNFDDVHVIDLVAPVDPTSLPYAEDFADGVADHLQARTNGWSVENGVYRAVPSVGSDAISTLAVTDPLPQDLDLQATFNAKASAQYSNALVVFDYQSNVDFKFAGAYVGTDRWVIGHRTASGWTTDASVTGTISNDTDYDVQVVIQNDSEVSLSINGIPKVSHTYAESLSDGHVGVGTLNALADFDDLVIKEYVPPPPPPTTPLPFSEDFSDGVADYFIPRVGTWDVATERYHATPAGDAVSTISIEAPLPTDLELAAVLNMDAASGGYYSNGLVVFDYQSPTDFKFAGAYVGSGKWVIGHRNASGWVTDASILDTINHSTDYAVQLVIENDAEVTLSVNGLPKVSHSFAGSLTDGELGLATYDALAHYDDVSVQAFVAPPPPPTTTLPVVEDFDDGIADFFQPRAGNWTVSNGRYHDAPAGDAVSTLNIDDAIPADVEIQATVNMDSSSGGLYSNGVLIFDYQDATDFKFAGAYAGSSKWVIGHRTTNGWSTDVTLVDSISAGTDYLFQVVIQDDSTVSLNVNGDTKLTHTFADPVTDGEFGLGTSNAIAHFDDVVVQAYVEPPPPPSASLPYFEDFSDDVADFFVEQVGTWTASGGRYHDVPSGDAVTTLTVNGALPSDFEVQSIVNMDPSGGGLYSNGVLVFDYHSPTDFKFAGAYAGSNKWVIGHRTTSGRTTQASSINTINAGTDYQFQLVVENDNTVTLNIDGVTQVTHTYGDSVSDGQVGLGTFNAIAHFDDVVVQEYVAPPPPPSGTLPLTEDFEDGVADFFQPRVGTWDVSGGRYHDTPSGDAVSTLLLADPLPSDFFLEAVVNMNNSGGGYYSNGVLIFDYQSPTDFRFAGAYTGTNKWVIGHRTSSGRTNHVQVTDTINHSTDYLVRVTIENDNTAILSVDGVTKASYTFGGSLSDGDVGLGTFNALANYDDVLLQATGGIASASVPSGGEDVEEDSSIRRQRRLLARHAWDAHGVDRLFARWEQDRERELVLVDLDWS